MPKNFVGSSSEHSEKQFLFVGKAGVEGGFGSLGAPGDFGGTGSLVTFLHKDFGGHFEEPVRPQLFFLFGRQTGGFRSGHTRGGGKAQRIWIKGKNNPV